jgi:hypothetical protein
MRTAPCFVRRRKPLVSSSQRIERLHFDNESSVSGANLIAKLHNSGEVINGEVAHNYSERRCHNL